MSIANSIFNLKPLLMTQNKNKKAIYTFIINDYDDLKDPLSIADGWDYICFTDNPDMVSNTWKIIYLDQKRLQKKLKNPKKTAMLIMIEYFKLIPKQYDIVVSIGGQIMINTDLNEFITKHFDQNKHDLAICKHPERDCIYDEAEICKILNKDNASIIDKQTTYYRRKGYPAHNGLFMTGIIIRKNSSKNLKKVCKIWSHEVQKWSKRDQLSLNYSIWKSRHPISINTLSPDRIIGTNMTDDFIIKPHKNSTQFAQLFYSENETAFDESHSIRKNVNHQTSILKFSLNNYPAKRIRFDPLNTPCIVSIKKIKIIYTDDSQEEKSILKANAIHHHNQTFYFETNDPIIHITHPDVKKTMKNVEIHVEYLLMNAENIEITKTLFSTFKEKEPPGSSSI